ncbi:hypothetical protein VHEMI01970 [[Torrubiella] hemipterigena]|nr:hypothetical protein VHEMI01970 [[Torrubiella] hemipterigena]
MIKQKWPQLTLFISSFQDATFISLIWPHTLMDASGFYSLLKNWSYVMAGEMDKVEPVLGASVDVLAQIDTEANEKATHVLDPLCMSALQKTIFALRFLWRKMMVRQELRMVYIPDAVMRRLKDRTAQEAKDAAEKGDQDAFISEGDVLVGWLMRANAAAHSHPITLFSLVNARSRLPGTSKAEGVYIQNIIGMVFIMYSAEALKRSGGSIALKHRRSLEPQLDGDQLAMYMQKVRKTAVGGGIPPVLYGDSSAVLAASNNIAKSSPFTGADFGPAVIRAGDKSKDKKNPPGTMTVYYNCIVGPGSALPGIFLTWGRDHGRGLWLTASLSSDQWSWLEKDMASLSEG